jgi:hypothetical protein
MGQSVCGSTQIWTKTGTQMGHERTVCPFGLPRWKAFYLFFFIRANTIQTAGDRMGSPTLEMPLAGGTLILVNFPSLVVTD